MERKEATANQRIQALETALLVFVGEDRVGNLKNICTRQDPGCGFCVPIMEARKLLGLDPLTGRRE